MYTSLSEAVMLNIVWTLLICTERSKSLINMKIYLWWLAHMGINRCYYHRSATFPTDTECTVTLHTYIIFSYIMRSQSDVTFHSVETQVVNCCLCVIVFHYFCFIYLLFLFSIFFFFLYFWSGVALRIALFVVILVWDPLANNMLHLKGFLSHK